MFKIYTKDGVNISEVVIDAEGYFLLRELNDDMYEAFIYEENPRKREGYTIKEVKGECLLPFMKLRQIITPEVSHYYFLDFPYLVVYDSNTQFEGCL